ncbi:endo-1,4-beta-xylanase [Galbibacter sp. BG1]|uniref:endo-1,4-beta-xylanase n=1 Tax=Galbibacter sp. BG1 TaxID=1170699 RepID=UPI0015BD692D|nr:endo-1,4-beta-xylanase [Galbibacter sp. BG1]QLE02212.1 endo-1,4-beta-xylanase [Galbibacter sp. BG1]
MKLKISIITCLIFVFQITISNGQETIPSLKEKYNKFFPLGVAMGEKHLQRQDTVLVPYHFSSITAENDMKPSRTIASENKFTFERGDALVDFAKKHGLLVRGHTLVWYNQTDDWFYENDEGELLSKNELFKRMKSYIKAVLDHYRGDVYAWDVVNEAISDESDLFYREDIKWFQIGGPEYIEMAFRYAREADPDVKLFYNDYDLINPKKRDKAYKMLKELLEKGVPIDGVGMQGHWTLEDVNKENLGKAIDLFSSLGLEVQITELDISVYPYYHNMDRSTLPKEIKPYTPELASKLAEKYKEVFELLRAKKDKITGVTFWGVADNKTWLSNYVVKGRTDYPLLFDKDYNPKKAFYSIMDF